MGTKTANERLYVPHPVQPGARVLFAVPGQEYDDTEYARLAAGEGEGGEEEQDPPTGDEVPEDWRDRIAWIGDDPELAQRALEAETARDNPRPSVIEHAEQVLAAGEGEGGEEEQEDT